MRRDEQQSADLEVVGAILGWRALGSVPQHELNALLSHLRDEQGWSCRRVSEAVCRYRTCARLIRQLMMSRTVQSSD